MELTDLNSALRQVYEADCLEDVFGDDADETLVRKKYRALVLLLHPDSYADEGTEVQSRAEEGFKRFSELYDRALDAIENGTYGRRLPLSQATQLFTVTLGAETYTAELQLAEGEVSNVYTGFSKKPDGGRQPVIIKLSFGETPAEVRANNLLLKREAEALKKLYQGSDNPNLSHLPRHIAQFQTSDRALANIQSFCTGLDCYEIRQNPLYVNGVPEMHLFWILSRCLTTLGYTHSRGIIHGNIEPAHLIINPANHNVSIIDWCYSLREGEAFRACTEGFSPPEVESRLAPTPSADIYSLGKTIIYLAGGEQARRRMSQELDRLLEWMTRDSVIQRPRDAMELNDYVKSLRQRLFGRQGFVPMPI